MNQIILNKINPNVIAKLTNLAQKHQRTLEEEITSILEDVIDSQVITTPENKGWQKGFFEEVIGSWEGEPLVRETQPEYQERDFSL